MKFDLKPIDPAYKESGAMPVLAYGLPDDHRLDANLGYIPVTAVVDLKYDPSRKTLAMVFVGKDGRRFRYENYCVGVWARQDRLAPVRIVGGVLYVPLELRNATVLDRESERAKAGTLWVPKWRLVKVEKFREQFRVVEYDCESAVGPAANWMLHQYELDGYQGDVLLTADPAWEKPDTKVVYVPLGALEYKERSGFSLPWRSNLADFVDMSSGDAEINLQ